MSSLQAMQNFFPEGGWPRKPVMPLSLRIRMSSSELESYTGRGGVESEISGTGLLFKRELDAQRFIQFVEFFIGQRAHELCQV